MFMFSGSYNCTCEVGMTEVREKVISSYFGKNSEDEDLLRVNVDIMVPAKKIILKLFLFIILILTTEDLK